jgi:salicylate hydroxylase
VRPARHGHLKLAAEQNLTSSRTVIVVGAGIGGLTAALALARSGFRVVVFEQAERLEEAGAGIQLSPNAARTLIGLGLEGRLHPHVVAPAALRVLDAENGREIVRMPLGDSAAQRYGAPYWVIHRSDLQAALADTVAQDPNIVLKLGARIGAFAVQTNGVTVAAQNVAGSIEDSGTALIAADGLWSTTRERMGLSERPRFAQRVAWRALIPAKQVSPEFTEPLVHLWLGSAAHLVHYPVKGGDLINIVLIMDDTWNAPGWSEPTLRSDLLERISRNQWAPPPLSLINAPDSWLKWALYDLKPLPRWSQGPVTLLGDAAHPMLPYLAQGAAMAIEDAAVVAQCLAQTADDPAAALQTYWAKRHARAYEVQRLAARNGSRYHLGGVQAMVRNLAMHALGGARLLHHYDWLYDWRPPAALPLT